MIPAPDAVRCDARYPLNSLIRCFRLVGHEADIPHVCERPTNFAAVTVFQWRDQPRPSEFPLGPAT